MPNNILDELSVLLSRCQEIGLVGIAEFESEGMRIDEFNL